MPSKNIPVNGWPQIKDLEAVQPTLDRLDKIEAWKRTVKEETFTGDDFIITNALKLPARSLKTTIEAIQDLHGYDKPWAGGAGKNKLATPYNLENRNNVYYTLNNEGSFTLNGTSDGVYYAYIKYLDNPIVLPVGTYTFSIRKDGVLGTGNLSARVRRYNHGVADDFNDFILNNGVANVPIVNADDVCAFFASAQNGANCSGTYSPQVEEGTTATPFAPYSNICPISGRTEARVDTENEDSSESAYAVIQLGQTVYGAEVNFDTGVVEVTDGYFASYDGETLPSTWISDRDVYAEGTTPSTGAEVVYKLATPTTLQLTPAQLDMLKGYNRVTLVDGYGTIELKALTGANWS